MHLHKEWQQWSTENSQVWPEQLLRVGVLLILDICNQGMENSPFCPRFCAKLKQDLPGDPKTSPVTWRLYLWPKNLFSFPTEAGKKTKITLELQWTEQNSFFLSQGIVQGVKYWVDATHWH